MKSGTILHRSQSRRTQTGGPATANASPTPMRRPGFRRAVSRGCFETLEGRRLLSFSPAVTYPAGASPQGIAAVEFNNDGNLDLITANADNTVNVLLGNAVGTFPPPQASAGDAYGRSTPGDVNGDGIPD